MSDRNHRHANGQSEPADLPVGDLADWWDRAATDRRSGSIDLPSSEPTVAIVAQLDALASADDLSTPRPGFLDQLERQIMQTPQAVLPTPITVRQSKPLLPIPFARPQRRGRGLVDILTVAAVLALLLGGSWSVFNDRANAPTPEGRNGVAGVATPEDSRTVTSDRADGVAIDRPWATNQDDDQIAGMTPVDTNQCDTAARPAGSVVERVRQVAGPTSSSNELSTDLFPTLEYVRAWDDLVSLIQTYPEAPDDQRTIAQNVYSQAVACRFDNGKQTSGDLEPYTGAYWSLFGTDYFLDRFNLRLTNPVLAVEEVVNQSFGDEPSVGGQGAYPPTVLDVRTLPPSADGSTRLLVLRQSVVGFATRSLDVLVLEDGLWRFAGQPVVTEVGSPALGGFSVDVGIGSGPSGAATIQVTGGQFEAETPVSLTIANRGTEPQSVDLDGQALGTIQPGESVRVRPFVVSNATVDAAGGRLDLTLTVRPVGDGLGSSAEASSNLQVFPSGGLASRIGDGPSTPAADATPIATDDAGLAVLDQPWVENQSDASLNGVLPVLTSECVTPSRAAGSVEVAVQERLDLGEAAPTIEPEFLAGARNNPGSYPPADTLAVEAMTEFFHQLSACRFETGERNGTQLLPYTGAYWNLYADDSFTFNTTWGPFSDLSVDELVRDQYSFSSSYVYGWSYPGTVVDVRQMPPDGEGNPRLLVTSEGSSDLPGETTSLVVQEDGQWRFLIADVAPAVYGIPVAAQVVDILLGQDGYGPRSSGNFSSQLEADFPVTMTIANVGETPQQAIVAGQDLGILQPGESIVVQPFTIRSDAVEGADGSLSITVESIDQEAGPDGPVARPYTIAVYAAGSLPYAPDEAGADISSPSTPVESSVAATPTDVVATPVSPAVMEEPVSVAVAAEPDRVVELGPAVGDLQRD